MKKTINGYTIAPGVNLSGVDLRNADLYEANLIGVDLRNADLYEANLIGVDLNYANLSNANLIGANLNYANLGKADLSGANLGKADLSGANLSNADLSGANLSGASLCGANLSKAKGLGTKEGEMSFASLLVEEIHQNPKILDMNSWHCGTTHCIAGHAFPELEFPGQPASLQYPTLAQYFFTSNEEAIAALERVARGEESVFG